MGWYIARRIAIMVPVFLGATLLIYGMVFLLPGDPIAALAGDRPLSPAVAAQLRAQYHLNDPFLLQYLHYLGGIVHGDLGRAYSGLPVSVVLAQAFPVTIRLALIALAVEAALGIGFGVIAGLRQGAWQVAAFVSNSDLTELRELIPLQPLGPEEAQQIEEHLVRGNLRVQQHRQ